MQCTVFEVDSIDCGDSVWICFAAWMGLYFGVYLASSGDSYRVVAQCPQDLDVVLPLSLSKL